MPRPSADARLALAARGCRGFVPPYLLRHLAEAAPEPTWSGTLAEDARLRGVRAATAPAPPPRALVGVAAWTVHDAAGGTDLPGRPVLRPGDPPTGDEAVDEAGAGVTASLALFSEVYGRDSYDDRGAPVSLSVHYGRNYANAFWDGTQLVFGDGDGRVFGRMTRAVDVLGHELSHAVTEHSAGLVYEGQSGALNESVSDVFASCLKQRLLGQEAAEGDWLVGAGLFLPGVAARGLRDLAAPGTAYDDPALGRDPQPGHLDDYVETDDDNGGVHLNSGIPNRAFHLAALAVGGTSWDGAGRIWYAALTGGLVGPRTDFAGFAAATVAAAGEHADAVAGAWAGVGVRPGAGSASAGPEPAGATSRVRVRRSGGFAGLTAAGELDLDSDDERRGEVAGLVDRIELGRLSGGPPRPDMFVYDFDVRGQHARLPEQDLTPDLRRLAELLLDPGDR
ncbi:protealysin inhibitor emfourin [Nocardioides pantholopis]|uniref:protealysin inhibitor emfourin n=1 Tax=Nocardioides pantholopis TaxID=2483798 RepID=UPI000F090E27|nr:protealysin inhibitor emfourin [Nocardioides pantholopis]